MQNISSMKITIILSLLHPQYLHTSLAMKRREYRSKRKVREKITGEEERKGSGEKSEEMYL